MPSPYYPFMTEAKKKMTPDLRLGAVWLTDDIEENRLKHLCRFKFCCFELIAGKNIVLGREEGSSEFFLLMLRGEDGTAGFGYFIG